MESKVKLKYFHLKTDCHLKGDSQFLCLNSDQFYPKISKSQNY
jgi:hypothetical protein